MRLLLLAEIRERAFCLSRERLPETSKQGLGKGSLRFALLLCLDLRHSQIKKRIGVERLFPSAFLQQLDGARVFLFLVAQSPEKLGQFRIIWQCLARFCSEIIGSSDRGWVLGIQHSEAFLRGREIGQP